MRGGPVVDLSRSPYASLRPVPLAAVRLQDAFWTPRLTRNREVTLPAQRKQCEETGRIDNFRRAAGKKTGDFQGIYFNDSDVYKWVEAASLTLATHPDPEQEAVLDAVVTEIAAAQEADGYLNTYFTFERAPERFTNLRDMHEIYCAGHLMQAAVAHHRATGKTTLLEVACRLADCLDNTFGPGKRAGACGHEEAEMALVELYRETREARYLALAQRMVEARGQKPPLLGGSAYHQDHLPFLEQHEMVGHAVRHLYLCCGATDLCLETGAEGVRKALDALWDDLTTAKLYVTGGAGSRYEGEAFGNAFELPNDRAYTETCAAIGSLMWNWRLLHLTGTERVVPPARCADLLETTLYNAVLPGLALDGTHYFYQNPLADRGTHRRQEWFGCACCPPNLARLLPQIPSLHFSVSATGVFVHLYSAGTATLPMPSGGSVSLHQQSNYPWEGEITVTVTENASDAKSLYLRVPAWAADAHIEANGTTTAVASGAYAEIPMPAVGAPIKLVLPMPIVRIESHPHVQGNMGRVALRRGPLIYCMEQVDHPDADVWDIALPDNSELTPQFVPDLLGGVTVLQGRAVAQESPPAMPLYSTVASPRPSREVDFTAIPYYAWANRDPGPMTVWIPRQR